MAPFEQQDMMAKSRAIKVSSFVFAYFYLRVYGQFY